MNIPEQLREAGLQNSEIKVYLYLLEHGFSTPPQIAKGTHIARPNCYKILRALQEKSLIREQKNKKRNIYVATDPLSIVHILERRKKAIEGLLPDLRSLYLNQKNKPIIHYYEGFEEIKEIFGQTLEAEEIWGFASTQKLFSQSPKFFEKYRKKLKEKGIIFRDIITHESGENSGPKAQAELKGLYEFTLLPKQFGDIPTDILIWNDNIALITTMEPIFGTVLTNTYLAETFKILFKLAWSKLNY